MFGVIFYEVIKYMPYIALYRKYRPNTFDSIVNQDSITKILKNQIKTGKISHAYIFSGSRGTGKTSAAKVFARAINCLNPKDGEPCNECSVCKSILEGNTTDVVEMDAASNNSVENIRQIRQEVVYSTIDVKYRVYIIDEAHMLTTSAFNALLKTLEEPPENVVFILATTEQHKIPVTILSRCLRFEFNRISEEKIIERLKYVLDNENIKYEQKAIEYIAKLAEGGMRDALSILERCISESENTLEYEDVQKIVGAIDVEIVKSLMNSILELNSIDAIKCIDKVVEKGKDLRQLNYELTEMFLEKLTTLEKEDTLRYVRIIDRLSKLDSDLRQTSKPVIVFKAAIVEICNIETMKTMTQTGNINMEPILKKINMLEEKIEKLKKDSINITRTATLKIANKSMENKETVENVEEELVPFTEFENFKKQVVESGKLKIYSALASANMYLNKETLIIITSNSFAYGILNNLESIDALKQIYNENYGGISNILIRLDEKKEDNTPKFEKILKQNNVDYTQID